MFKDPDKTAGFLHETLIPHFDKMSLESGMNIKWMHSVKEHWDVYGELILNIWNLRLQLCHHKDVFTTTTKMKLRSLITACELELNMLASCTRQLTPTWMKLTSLTALVALLDRILSYH